MPSNSLTFYASNFINPSPSNIPDGGHDSNLQFTTITKTLEVGPDHTSNRFYLQNLSGDYDYGSISFSTPNGTTIGVRRSSDDLYIAQPEGVTMEYAFKDLDGFHTECNTIDVITNGDPDSASNYLNIHISLAHLKQKPSSNTTLTLINDCDHSSIYSYETGVHVYSPYDAQSSVATLTTKLYSFSQITNWGVNTNLYSTPYFSQPALPYWYGYGSKLFRVGSQWNRSYGLQDYVVVRKKLFKKPKVKEYTRGPLETFDPVTQTSEACVEPVFKDVGKIKVYINNPSPSAPQQYRYYLGFDSNKFESSKKFFKAISFEKNKSYPITGFQHALNKLPRGMISGFIDGIRVKTLPLLLLSALGSGIIWANIAGVNLSVLVRDKVLIWLGEGIANILPQFLTVSTQAGTFGAWLASALPVIFLVIAIIFLIIAIFSTYTKTYIEECPRFLHHFTDSPYLSVGDEIYRDEDLTEKNIGWYCDGSHYFYQNNSNITTKIDSNVYSYIQDDPFTQYWVTSPDPTSPSLVTDFGQLMFLPYVSGKPSPHCGGDVVFYSEEFSETLIGEGCDMQIPPSETVTLPASASSDCVSVANANEEAEQLFSASLETVRKSLNTNYGSNISDEYISEFGVDFTHELKTETNPTQIGLFYDNRSGSLSVGTPLYYDPQGCQKALSGWYASGSSSPYRTFYRVDEGYITDISLQVSVGSNSTDDGKPILTTDLDYTSNWFQMSYSETPLVIKANQIYNVETFDPNTIYTLNNVVAGYFKSASLEDFQIFNNFSNDGIVNTSSMVEAQPGFYLPFNDWIDSDGIFQYQDTLYEFDCSIRGLTPNSVCPFAVTDLSSSLWHNGSVSSPVVGDRVYRDIGINLKDLHTKIAAPGYYKINSSDLIYVNYSGIVSEVRACTPAESTPPGGDVDPVILGYNFFNGPNACNDHSGLSDTFYLSGSTSTPDFDTDAVFLFTTADADTFAPYGHYSDGDISRYWGELGFSNTSDCTSTPPPSMNTLMIRYNTTEAGACNTNQTVRIWYSGNNWHDSTIYSATGSNGLGSVIASNFWYSNSLAVREWENGSWVSNVGLCEEGFE